MAKVKLGWALLTIPQKIIKATSIVDTMGKNADVYATPDPSLSAISDKAGELSKAEAEAIKGGTDRTVIRNARLDELTALMNTLVDYVQLTSGGDPEKIVKSGMEVKNDPSSWPVPFKTPGLEAIPGANSGTVQLSWEKAKYAKTYVVEVWVEGPEPDTGSWQVLVIQNKREYTSVGLTTGKNYRFRVAAQNSAGMGPYSDEAQSVAR